MPKRFYTLQPKKKAVIAVWEPGQVPSLHVETKEPEEDAETWPLDMKPNV